MWLKQEHNGATWKPELILQHSVGAPNVKTDEGEGQSSSGLSGSIPIHKAQLVKQVAGRVDVCKMN